MENNSSNINVNGSSDPDRSGDDLERDSEVDRRGVLNANTKDDGNTKTTDSSVQPDVATSFGPEIFGDADELDEETFLYVPPDQNPTMKQLATMLSKIEEEVNRSSTGDGHSPTSHRTLELMKMLSKFFGICFTEEGELRLDFHSRHFELLKNFVKLGGPARLMFVLENSMEDPDMVKDVSELHYLVFYLSQLFRFDGEYLPQVKSIVKEFTENGGIRILQLASEEFEPSLTDEKNISAVGSVWRLLSTIPHVDIKDEHRFLSNEQGLDIIESAYICARHLANSPSSLSTELVSQKKFALSWVSATIKNLLRLFEKEDCKAQFVEVWHQHDLLKPFLDFCQLHKTSMYNWNPNVLDIVRLFTVGHHIVRLSNDDILKTIDITTDIMSNVFNKADDFFISRLFSVLEELTDGVDRNKLAKTSLFCSLSTILQTGFTHELFNDRCMNLLAKTSNQTG